MSAPFQIYFAILLFFVSNTQAAFFKTLAHGVEGEVKVEGHTIVVENFSYDGTAPDAFFYVGTSGCPSGAGTRLGDEQLGEYSGQRIELELPNNIRAGDMTLSPHCPRPCYAGDVTWVSVWCRQFSVDFGHAFLSSTAEENCSSGSSGSGSTGNGSLLEYEMSVNVSSGDGVSGNGVSGNGTSGNGTSGTVSSRNGFLAMVILITLVVLGVI